MISIVIPAHNRPQLLCACVRRIKEIITGQYEIIVVDDGGTIPIGMAGEGVQIVNSISRGPGGARNLGARQARGDILFFLDSDVLLCSHAFEMATECLLRTQYQAVQGIYAPHAGYADFFSKYKNAYWHFNQMQMDPEAYSVCTAILAIFREEFLRTGGFNERSLIGEDREFGLQLQKSNVKILQVKELQGTHYKSFNFWSLVLYHFQSAVNYAVFLLKFKGDIVRPRTGGGGERQILEIVLSPLLAVAAFFLLARFNAASLLILGIVGAGQFFLSKDFLGHCIKQEGLFFAIGAFFMRTIEHMVAFLALGWGLIRYFLYQRKDLNFRIPCS